jgi:folate-binding protein YgfZ
MSESTPVFCNLEHLGCIAVAGADARAFLNAQLGTDLPAPGTARAPLVAWHTAKGRVRALFRAVPHGDGWLLVASREALPALLQKLELFVLRADVALSEDGDTAVAALVGADAESIAPPELEQAPQAVAARGGTAWLRIGPGLIWIVGRRDALERAAESLPTAPAERAALAEIRLGLPLIGTALAERFLPQMLNLDLLGAVAFDKGCYPGQEVIARAQNLGTVKRRLARFGGAGGAPPAPGSALVDASGDTAGEVVRAAAAENGYELLAVVRLDAQDGPLFIAGGGTALARLPLPYASP